MLLEKLQTKGLYNQYNFEISYNHLYNNLLFLCSVVKKLMSAIWIWFKPFRKNQTMHPSRQTH